MAKEPTPPVNTEQCPGQHGLHRDMLCNIMSPSMSKTGCSLDGRMDILESVDSDISITEHLSLDFSWIKMS
jgi:hypothetical protein